ncbi:MAG TPA: ABC transporter substrate-binding protein, partial [Candidatus Acetothermia bacterium]|nr:ABC transporter substrate-binding protein [Candidatus Acetothermia bacterium]
MWRKVLLLALVGLFIGGLAWAKVDRTGAWVDEVVFQEEPDNAKAIAMLEAGQGDLYAYSIANPELFKQISESKELKYVRSYGVYTELTFNPVLKFKDGRLNPFGDPKIREAM